MIEDRGTDKESIFVTSNLRLAPVKNELCPLVNTLLDPVTDLLLMSCIDHRAKLRLFLIGTTDFECLCLFLQQCDKCVRNAFLDTDHR